MSGGECSPWWFLAAFQCSRLTIPVSWRAPKGCQQSVEFFSKNSSLPLERTSSLGPSQPDRERFLSGVHQLRRPYSPSHKKLSKNAPLPDAESRFFGQNLHACLHDIGLGEHKSNTDQDANFINSISAKAPTIPEPSAARIGEKPKLEACCKIMIRFRSNSCQSLELITCMG